MAEADKLGESDSVIGRIAKNRKTRQQQLDEASGFTMPDPNPKDEQVTNDHKRGYTRDGGVS